MLTVQTKPQLPPRRQDAKGYLVLNHERNSDWPFVPRFWNFFLQIIKPFLASWRLGGGIFAAVLLMLVLAGCGGRQAVKPGGEAQVAATPTPKPSGPQAPALVDLKVPVADADYQQAVSQVGDAEANRRNAQSYLLIGQYQYNHADLDGALKTYQKVLLVDSPAAQRDKAQYMVGQVYYDKQDYLPALASFQNVLTQYPKSMYVTQSHQMMDFILDYSLSLDDLKSYVANYPDSPLLCSALFQLGSREDQGGYQTDAIEHLNQFLQQCPRHPSVAAAQMLLQKLQSEAQGKTWKIGVLVPRTGAFKSFGESVLSGIILAVDQSNQAGGSKRHMTIVVRDTGSDGMMAVTEFQDMIKDDSLDAVIGPVAPTDIPAVAALANEHHIIMLCPASSRDGLSSLGPYIFSNSMTNEMQGRAIAKFALDRLGFKKFAILSPDDTYGQTLGDAFQKTVEAAGNSLSAWQTYHKGDTDYKEQLIDLGGQDPEASKNNDRENARRLDELKYNISKEIGKIFLMTQDLSNNSGLAVMATPGAAYVPMVESLSNTICPSVAGDVDAAVREALKSQTGVAIRNDDLVKQSLKLLPIELKGTTLTATAEQWNEVAQDLQASILITGHIVEPTPEFDWTNHPTWDYNVHFEGFWIDPKTGSLTKIYQKNLPYSLYKPSAMLRGNTYYQALYLPAHAAEIPLLVSQIHFYDLNPVFLGGHLWDNPGILQDTAKDMEGSYFVTGFYADSQQSTAKKFSDDYLNQFHKKPDLLAAQAFDAARLILQATDLSSSREDIRTNLLAIKDFDGVSGKTSFDGHGEADKLVPVIQIKDGKYNQVQ
jgi:ABC-type branched-subunit amino acid transport system substrate-binding protein